MKFEHYYKKPVKKMGKWTLLPADSGSWHGLASCQEFRKVFGFGKGLLGIHTFPDGYQHMYAPVSYFDKLYGYIIKLRKKSLKAFEVKIARFYKLKAASKKEVPKLSVKDYAKLSNKELANLYKEIRHWIHRTTVYDQFGWLSEDYWNEPMDEVLVKKLEMEKSSGEYHKLLFTLTKPEEISTTLEEKRAVLKGALTVKKDKKKINSVAKKLAKSYGWMPVFAFGDPWDEHHYSEELSALVKKSEKYLRAEYDKLRDYTKIRNKDIQRLADEYGLGKKDLQVFIDFGLALDARNEAEYILSFCSFYLLPIYKEAAKRLALSVKQLRMLEETEIVACLKGQKEPHSLLDQRRKFFTMGFDKEMKNIFFLNEQESAKLFRKLEKQARQETGGDAQGLTASPGKVNGPARIVLSPDENGKVKEGDILITIATTVDYLPAMKKAVAFVTEVGGLTCHAAVVAREFGVPCIVSSHGVTVKFKDGEMVEVDANKGMVRKLS